MKCTVFLASKRGNDDIYENIIRELGCWIGKNGHELVYGGTHTGLMGILSESVRENGGRIIGVGVKVPKIESVIRNDLDVLYMCDDMFSRKKKMMELADIFVVFPGSFGTLDELTDVLSALKLKQMNKPVYIMNVNGFYEPLRTLFDSMITAGFIDKETMENVHFISEAAEIR